MLISPLDDRGNVFGYSFKQEHQKLVGLAVWCLLDFQDHLLELLAFHF